MRFDSVVIGGGISGLSAALLLARYGRHVALVEKSSQLSPVIQGFSRSGTWFDSGFHYTGGLGEGEILDLLLKSLGVSERLEKMTFRSDGYDLFRDADSGWEFSFPCGENSLEEALNFAFPTERKSICDFLRALDQACQNLPYMNLDLEVENWDGAQVIQEPSLATMLDRLTENPRLKKLLSLHTLLHGMEPEEVSFTFHASVVAPYYRSIHGIRGGGSALADGFRSQLLETGVEIFTGCEAKRLVITEAGEINGVELHDGNRLECKECISSIHPGRFLDLVPEQWLRPVYRRRLAALEDTMSAFILYAASEKKNPALEGRNLFLGRFDTPETDPNGIRDGRTIFVAKSVTEKPGYNPGWTAICPLYWDPAKWGQRGEGYRRDKKRITEQLLERIGREAPEIADGSRVVAAATPLTIRDYVGSPVGGLYGVKHRLNQYNPQPATRIKGVYMTGQATAAPGLLGAVLSSFLTCGHLLGHEKLRAEVLACR